MNFISKTVKPFPSLNPLSEAEASPKNTAPTHTNSLAYLAYQNRKQKGLISGETLESPIIFFGDEWTL